MDENSKTNETTDNVQKVEIVKTSIPGESNATTSLILGILAAVFGFTGIVAFVLGICGIVQAKKAKALGCNNASATAGYILSIIAVVFGACAIFFLLTMCMSALAMPY